MKRTRVEKLLSWIRLHPSSVAEFLFLAVGLIGVCLQALHPGDPGAEMMTVAENVAKQGAFANPFFILATGPTAVVPPLYPMLLAGLITVLRKPILIYGATVLGTILANAATAMLLPRVSMVFYGDMVPGVFAAILWAATMQSMPGWDTNYTVAGLLLFCVVTSSPVNPGEDRNKRAVLAGSIAGLLFLLNPSTILISLPWLVFALWRTRADSGNLFRHAGIVLVILSIFVVAWGSRNSRQLGAFVIRTNLGMTLYSSNNDCAESSMFSNELHGCYQEYHPNANLREAELVRRVGEVRYDRQRIADAEKWAQANPAKFLKLTATRIREFWFPATELPFARAGGHDSHVIPQYVWEWVRRQNGIVYAIWFVTGLSIPGLFLMARRREAVTAFLLPVLAIYPLMYYIVVSDMRYRYPILFLSLLPAGYLIREVTIGKTPR